MSTSDKGEYEQLLRFVYASQIGLVEVEADGTIGMINPFAMRLLLPIARTPSITNFFDLMDGCAPELHKMVDAFTAHHGTVCENYRISISSNEPHSGAEAHVLACTMVKLDDQNLTATIADVSGQVAQERRLKHTESWFASLLEDVNDFAARSIDADGFIAAVNPSVRSPTSVNESQQISRKLDLSRRLNPMSHTSSMPEQIALASLNGQPLSEAWQKYHDGKPYWGQRLIAVLIRSLEQVDESIIITDLEASILYVNPAFEKITGYTRAEGIGNNPRILNGGRQPALLCQAMWATLLRGETWSGQLINKRKDGTPFNVEATISPIKNSNGKVVNYVAVERDVTQETVLRDQLNQAQKMEAMGQLSGGIAHDFNNLLGVIQSYTEMLQNSLPINDILRSHTEQVLKAAARGASLTGQMLAFSRKQIVSPVVLDLNAVIDETAKMLKRIIGEDIQFLVLSGKSLWAIEADPDQIVQVLMNLCVNSRDAMPQGGTLTIETGNVTVGKGTSEGQLCVSPGDYVRLSVADTGTGMDKELQERIFEPFFTTKEVGKGTGLGLSTVYGIVKQSGGYVWIDSQIGEGARFTIYLPKVKQTVAPNVAAKPIAPSRGIETLLVVEDDDSLREGICEFLRSLGYIVLDSGSGQQALLLASQQEHIDLLLTDVVMPKISGCELSQILASLRPDLKVIYMSGYTEDTVLRYGVQKPGAAFLQKPFSLGTLARKVRDTIDKKPESLHGTGLILVVDDEAIGVCATQAILEQNGYRVLTALNGEIAIRMVRENSDDLDLVILDLTMPVMGGAEAFAEINALAPDLPVIISSGYDAEEALSKFDNNALAGFIQKPSSAINLLKTVKTALNKSAAL